MPKRIYITASEIGDYVYCRHSWWLKFKEFTIDQSVLMERGTKAHNNLFKAVSLSSLRVRIALFLILFSLFLFGLLIIFIITGVI